MEKIEKLKSFLINSPQDSFLKHALALEYLKLGRDEEAKLLFTEILTAEPSYIGTYYHLGRLWERQGEKEKARAWYEKGVEEARKAGDHHAVQELMAALSDLDE